MTDELHEHTLEPEEEHPPIEPVAFPTPLKKSNKILWVISSIAICVVCLCLILSIVIIVNNTKNAITGKENIFSGFKSYLDEEKSNIEPVLDYFMKAMAEKATAQAFDKLSPRARHQITLQVIEQWVNGRSYTLFEGYNHLTITDVIISVAGNTDPEKPQGTVANVMGTITYDDGSTGYFTAVLEKTESVWQIYYVNISFIPIKIKT